MSMSNEERAEHAGNAMAEYLSSKGEPHDGPAEEHEISDLICDLLHHGDRFGFGHRDILDRALMHYEAEAAEEHEPCADNLLQALEDAERFISGFEDDPIQEGIDDLLERLRSAIEIAAPQAEGRRS